MSKKLLSNHTYETWEIDLSDMKHYTDITKAMEEIGAVDYVYTFVYNNEVIKHGLSTPTSQKTDCGDRIYRQAGHLDGWDVKLGGRSGDDMEDIATDYYAQTGQWLNRKNVKIIVRNLTGMSSPSVSDSKWHVKQLERKLIKEHVEQFGKLPIGNIKEESYVDNKAFVRKEIWERLVEEEI